MLPLAGRSLGSAAIGGYLKVTSSLFKPPRKLYRPRLSEDGNFDFTGVRKSAKYGIIISMSTLEKVALFWDVDPNTIELEKHAPFVVDRVLALGDLDDIAWVRTTYGDAVLKERVLQSRTLDAKSRSFWCAFYKLDPASCISTLSNQAQSPFSLRQVPSLPR